MTRTTKTHWSGWLGLGLLLALGACETGPVPAAPAVTTGELRGSAFPPGAIRTVTATSSAGVVQAAAPSATSGEFRLPGLAPGRYALAAEPAPGFVTAGFAYGTADVAPGQVTEAGVVSARSTATGAISGQVAPVGSVTRVTATGSNGPLADVIPDARMGVFVLENLVPGPYTLAFAPAAGYGPIAPRTLAVTGGATTSAGVIQVR